MDSPAQFRGDLPPSVPCPHCHSVVQIDEKHFEAYFKGATTACPKCARPFDWWTMILQMVKEQWSLLQLSPVGARLTFFQITLRPGESTTVNLGDHEIPSDAKILNVGYTPQGGGLFPLEIHGNMPQRHIIPSTFRLYSMPLGPGPHTETTVAVVVSWVPSIPEDYSWRNLLDAFEAYSVGRYQSMIIPANVAVESTLYTTLAAYLDQFVPSENVSSFLEDGATYDHQLNVVLPTLVSIRGLPPLPVHIRGLLNRLKRLRNQMAHKGRLKKHLETEEAAECLCSALFGFVYIRIVGRGLLTAA